MFEATQKCHWVGVGYTDAAAADGCCTGCKSTSVFKKNVPDEFYSI